MFIISIIAILSVDLDLGKREICAERRICLGLMKAIEVMGTGCQCNLDRISGISEMIALPVLSRDAMPHYSPDLLQLVVNGFLSQHLFVAITPTNDIYVLVH